jgi:hypothetical protein
LPAVGKIVDTQNFTHIIPVDRAGSRGKGNCEKNPHVLFVTGIDGSGVKSVAGTIFTGQHFVEVVRTRKGGPHMYIAREPDPGPATLILL